MKWLRRYRQVALLILATSFIPPIFLLTVSYFQAITSAKADLETASRQNARRFSELLRAAEITLKDIEANLENLDLDNDRAWKLLQRLAYNDPRFREIGIVNSEGFLVLTSLGPVEPPISVDFKNRADLSTKELQIVGPLTTALMQERSIVLVLPTHGKGEINILIDPVILSTYWMDLHELDLGPDGFIAYVNKRSQTIIAGSGLLPRDNHLMESSRDKGRLRVIHSTDSSDIYVVGEISRNWILQSWKYRLLIGSPVIILSSGFLLSLLALLFYRTHVLGYDIKVGLQNNEFELHYQPIFDLKTNLCVGSEALIRWRYSNQELLLPNLFIPTAEKTGLIIEIGKWIIERAVKEQEHLFKEYPSLYVSINLSPVQINSGNSNQTIVRTLEKDGALAKHLMFEITETTLIEDMRTAALDTIASIKSLGLRIALDDFGTGYSGINYTHKVEFDFLKIDRIYTTASDSDSNTATILDGIIDFGKRLQINFIAEGVETESQRKALLAKGINYGQGYFFSHPMPIREFENFLAKNLCSNLSPQHPPQQ